jgi:hypothetical protein
MEQATGPTKLQLYRDTAGRLVQVVSEDVDTVQFCSQGGGFVHRAPRADFERDFRPATPPAFQAAHFSAEWLDEGTQLEGFSNGMRWNGWAMPYFSREAGLRLCTMLPSLRFDADRNAFVSFCDDYPEGEQEEVFEACAVVVSGSPLELYPIGTGSWTWDEED